MTRIIFTKELFHFQIIAEALFCGDDLFVIISGGDKPHIGAISLVAKTPSIKNQFKDTFTNSVITVPGHKETDLAYFAAQKLAKDFKTTVVVSIGIHVEGITDDMIKQINDAVVELVDTLRIELQEHL